MGPPNKKRKLAVTAPETIEFDFAAREEYLTGFHKRKLERKKHAQEENAKREKEEKLRLRRELRAERKADLEKHVQEVNRLVKQANGDLSETDEDGEGEDEQEEEFTGFQEPEPINQEDEYIDEDKYTTVTMESVNISKSGFSRPGEDDEHDEAAKKKAQEAAEAEAAGADGKKRVWTKAWPKNSDKPKKKKKKFRYETKTERKAERIKQGLKKKKQKEARMNKK
ncbi:Ribosomal RNA-processing protein 17 [Curvularia clavata]|uniref:Ribosomal RNA-processing protein 17 n=1 Tax=Curvularia clavata TaxID=95742 RepID=A0A9Q8ZFS3_CURCL|nr:Ribosomal RNA-processing protein 17 [Curvularia clavata]